MTTASEVLLTALVVWGVIFAGGVVWALWTSTRELKRLAAP